MAGTGENVERETSGIFGERERERAVAGFYKTDTWRERVGEPLGCVHLNT